MDLARLRESISHITFYLINVAHDDHESIRKARNDVYDTDTCRLRVLKSNFDGREKRLNRIIRKANESSVITSLSKAPLRSKGCTTVQKGRKIVFCTVCLFV